MDYNKNCKNQSENAASEKNHSNKLIFVQTVFSHYFGIGVKKIHVGNYSLFR